MQLEDLDRTLEESLIKSGAAMYVEVQTEGKMWPSDTKEIKKIINKNNFKKAKGVYNMGNTCYLNSALQCLAHTPFLREYFAGITASGGTFLSDKRVELFKHQVNVKNPLGHSGRLAEEFSKVLKGMWTSRFAIAPRNFKTLLGKINEQFEGRDQQDSQEFLSFMLDALHEELNIIMRKPFVENPESNGREELDLKREMWANHLRRNWSLFTFLFFG